MNINTIKEKLNNEISKINVERIKNDAQKYGYKAALTAVEFGSKVVEKTEVLLKKDTTPTKNINVDEVSIEVEIYPEDKTRKKINRKKQAKVRTIIIRK